MALVESSTMGWRNLVKLAAGIRSIILALILYITVFYVRAVRPWKPRPQSEAEAKTQTTQGDVVQSDTMGNFARYVQLAGKSQEPIKIAVLTQCIGLCCKFSC